MRPSLKCCVMTIMLVTAAISAGTSYGQTPPGGDPTGDIVRGALDDTWTLYNATEDLYRVTNFRAIWTIGTDPEAFVLLQQARTKIDLGKAYLDEAEAAWDAYVLSGNNNHLLACAADTSKAQERLTEAGTLIIQADMLIPPEGPGQP